MTARPCTCIFCTRLPFADLTQGISPWLCLFVRSLQRRPTRSWV
jgi:hypothetical protein